MNDYSDYDGPPAWWTARQARRMARRPLCDEYGTPRDEGEDEADAEDTEDGEGEE